MFTRSIANKLAREDIKNRLAQKLSIVGGLTFPWEEENIVVTEFSDGVKAYHGGGRGDYFITWKIPGKAATVTEIWGTEEEEPKQSNDPTVGRHHQLFIDSMEEGEYGNVRAMTFDEYKDFRNFTSNMTEAQIKEEWDDYMMEDEDD